MNLTEVFSFSCGQEVFCSDRAPRTFPRGRPLLRRAGGLAASFGVGSGAVFACVRHLRPRCGGRLFRTVEAY